MLPVAPATPDRRGHRTSNREDRVLKTKKSEVVTLAEGLQVELEKPLCELHFPGCTGEIATHGIRVHGCAFHYSCTSCSLGFNQRVAEAMRTFHGTNLRCTKCHISYTPHRYFKIVEL